MRRVLPARLRRRAGAELDPGAGGRRGEADRRRHGSPTSAAASARTSVLLAQAYPRTTVVGSDYHAESIELARKKAAEAGVGDRVSFEVATAQTLHRHRLRPGDDVRRPARHGRPGRRRAPGARGAGARTAPGCWSSRTPPTASRRTSTRSGRLYYAGSTFLCVPNALSQPGGYALGAQAGEAAIREVATEAGLHPVPPGRADAVQPGLRDPAVVGS